MVYRGVARGKVIELEDNVSIPEGTKVEVLIKQELIGETTTAKDSPKVLLAALKVPARCTSDDVETLVQSMQQGKQAVRFEGIFE